MQLPVWLTFAVAAVVSSFGLYRLKIAFRSRAAEAKSSKRRGLYSLPRRTHVLFGLLYLLLGLFLVATALGWVSSPFATKPAVPRANPNLIEVSPSRTPAAEPKPSPAPAPDPAAPAPSK